ncbi:hypothetical protein Taro_011700 [Colocasia esculenta]|uniref:C2H2-type domain-containing protein n=1 Tax=Colocasia esculenta TaxID=4460 RepID=A0A843UGX3_COLES|nr:hypothetical protein [Colocasia esculenta]
MEQSRYWLWRRTLGGMPHLPPLAAAAAASTASFHDSWEEQAFAEDSAGPFGGCVWPPRSYSCSFCKREFRSAQALGGHMNVHRRDRARLRLSSPTNHIESGRLHSHHHYQQPRRRHPSNNPCSTPPAAQRPLAYSNSPKMTADPGSAAAALPLSPSRVSLVSSTHETCSEHTLVSHSYSSSLMKEDQKRPLFSITRLDSDPCSLQILSTVVPELELGIEGSQKLKQMESEMMKRGSSCFEEKAAISTTKRRRIDVAVPFISLGSSPGGSIQSEVLLELGATPIEELDLELRLGDRPKLK